MALAIIIGVVCFAFFGLEVFALVRDIRAKKKAKQEEKDDSCEEE